MGVEGKGAVLLCGCGPRAFAGWRFRAPGYTCRLAGRLPPRRAHLAAAAAAASRSQPAALRTTARMSLKNLHTRLLAPVRDPRAKRQHYRHRPLKQKGYFLLNRKQGPDARPQGQLWQLFPTPRAVSQKGCFSSTGKVHLHFQEGVSI